MKAAVFLPLLNNNLPAVLQLSAWRSFLFKTDVSAETYGETRRRYGERQPPALYQRVERQQTKKRWVQDEVEDNGLTGASSQRERLIFLKAN